jgi:DNA-directed DNA polymerase III PolC
MGRVIVHLDADAFFASVEQAADPRLRGKPIAVGGEKRGIIASASYEARKFGVYTPMPTARARKLCPKLIVLPGDFERYEQFSRWMFGYCYDFTPDVEQTSIDEGYFDLTANHRKPAADIAQTIRRAIQQALKISVSEGLGSNKLVSQVASKLNKPASFLQVPAGFEIRFLHPLPNRWLPGVGPKTAARLNSAGLAEIRHIAATPLEMLELLMGNQARQLRQFSLGIDERPLVPAREPQKSFSQQETFSQDLTDEEYLLAVLRRMADQLFAKVREESCSVRTLTVKVRYNDMAEDQCGESLGEPTDLETDVYERLGAMLRSAWKRRVSLRLVSLKLSNIYDGVFRSELPLEVNVRKQLANERLARVVDDLRRLHGRSVVLRGHDFRLRSPPEIAGVTSNSKRLPVRIHIRSGSPAKQVRYIPLRVHSYYSFLDSTLSPRTIVSLAVKNEIPAIALCDTGNVHGAADFFAAARDAGVRPILGVELWHGEHPLLLYVESQQGYSNLCQLLSRHAAQPESEECSVAAQQRRPYVRREFEGCTEGLIAVAAEPSLANLFPGRFYLAACRELSPSKFPTVACPAIHHAQAQDRQRYDIVQSIRTLTLLRQSHPEKRLTGRYHFRTPSEMISGCREHPEWLEHAREIADRCRFEFPFGKPQFPAFRPPDGSTAREFLRRISLDGFRRRYDGKRLVDDTGNPVSLTQVRSQLETELTIIAKVGYEDLFLITWDLLQTCRERGIDWITRGSAADSLVCYCLGISDVCPIRFGLYFRRFLNKERMVLHKLPDIDVDFPHDRKDDVVNLLFAKYGSEHCAVVGGFSTFQARSAVADVAKVLGAAEFQIRRFTERFPWSIGSSWEEKDAGDLKGTGLIERLKAIPECRDLPLEEEPFRTAVEMGAFLDGFPRHPKMHPCGVVLSRQAMHELTPTFVSNKGWPTTHLDMDAVEAVGLVKMDVLAQGGLAVMRDAKQTLAQRGIEVDLVALEPWEDPKVWEMIAGGGGRAVHHIESPAMVGLCRQSNVREIDGLVAIVSVIRPGAANEQKKQKFTRRYQGMEPPEYPHPSLEPCLRSTFGLVVYEEHILQICEAFAGLSPGRADVLRRALVKQKQSVIREIGVEFAASSRLRGHQEEKIKEVWELVTGFNGYAFCKAHSTAYGVEAYQAAWLKRYYPAKFMAGVLTNGKGFYHPLVYVLECHRLGIELMPPSVNEPGPTFVVVTEKIRVPVTRAKGLTRRTTDRICSERQHGRFASLADFYRRVAPQPEEIEIMIRVGAFDEFGQSRTGQFWEAQQVQRIFGQSTNGQGWLLPATGFSRQSEIPLAEPNHRQRLQWETEYFDFAVSGHPLELFADIAWDAYCPVSKLGHHIGEQIVTCGLVIEQRTHHQVTGEPMKFLTLADWTGMVETELFAATYRTYGLATARYPVLEITGTVEPFENNRGFSLRVIRAGKPRTRSLVTACPNHEISTLMTP